MTPRYRARTLHGAAPLSGNHAQLSQGISTMATFIAISLAAAFAIWGAVKHVGNSAVNSIKNVDFEAATQQAKRLAK